MKKIFSSILFVLMITVAFGTGLPAVLAQEGTAETTATPPPATTIPQPVFDPCDFNRDGKVDDFEKQKCAEPVSTPAQQLQTPQPPSQQLQPVQPQFEEKRMEENEGKEDFVDPREIQNVLRQIRDMKREGKQLLKRAAKLKNAGEAVVKINEVLSQAGSFESSIQNPPAGTSQREAIQDFYEARLWETLNEARDMIEIPNEIKMIEKDLARLEKMIAKKTFTVERVDMNVLRSRIGEIKAALDETRNYLAQGNYEDARESLSIIREGLHPGEIMNVLNQLYNLGHQLKGVKQDVKNEIHGVLEEVYVAIADGEFREANMMLNEVMQELWRLIPRLKKKPVMNNEWRAKFDQLEKRVQQKSQEIEDRQNNIKKEAVPQSQLEPRTYQPYQASLFENVRFFLSNLFSSLFGR